MARVWLAKRQRTMITHPDRVSPHIARTQAQVRMVDCMHPDADGVRAPQRPKRGGKAKVICDVGAT